MRSIVVPVNEILKWGETLPESPIRIKEFCPNYDVNKSVPKPDLMKYLYYQSYGMKAL